MSDRPVAASVPDGLELRKDGTIRLTIDGEAWRLRRPKLGELRSLRESLRDREDAQLRLLSEQMPNGDQPKDDTAAVDTSASGKLETALALNAKRRTLADEIATLNIVWMQQALTMLADHAPPEPDDWPAGLDSSDAIAQIVQHWRSVPLRSGGS